MQQRVEERDRQKAVGVVNVERRVVVGFLVPEDPSREERIEDGLHQRRPEEPCALFVIDIEGQTQRLAIVVEKRLERFEIVRQRILGVRKQLLDDLYIRFIRLAEERIGLAAEYGVVSYISNSSYLTGRSHPLMRRSLLANFDAVWVDNLNGDKYRTGKMIPNGLPSAGTRDDSAFTTEMDPRGIQPGTAIATWIKRTGASTLPAVTEVRYRDFWGTAAWKRQALIASLPNGLGTTPDAAPTYEEIHPSAEGRWRLSPRVMEGGFEAWPALDELFPVTVQGVNHNRGIEGSVIDANEGVLAKRIADYIKKPTFAAASAAYPELAPPTKSDGKPAIVGYEPEAEGIAWVTAQPISRRTHRGVAFLDPFGAKLDWASIQKLADTGLFEVVINFALSMAIQRMLPNSGEVPDGWVATLDSFFGSRAWFEEVYKQREGGLFAMTGFEKRADYSERLLELYRARLRSSFGHVSTPRLIRNTRGAPLYYLLWAGPNKKGFEGADYILTMGERLGPNGKRAAR